MTCCEGGCAWESGFRDEMTEVNAPGGEGFRGERRTVGVLVGRCNSERFFRECVRGLLSE